MFGNNKSHTTAQQRPLSRREREKLIGSNQYVVIPLAVREIAPDSTAVTELLSTLPKEGLTNMTAIIAALAGDTPTSDGPKTPGARVRQIAPANDWGKKLRESLSGEQVKELLQVLANYAERMHNKPENVAREYEMRRQEIAQTPAA